MNAIPTTLQASEADGHRRVSQSREHFQKRTTPGLRQTTESTPRGRAVCAPHDTRTRTRRGEASHKTFGQGQQPRTRSSLGAGSSPTTLPPPALCGHDSADRVTSPFSHSHSFHHTATVRPSKQVRARSNASTRRRHFSRASKDRSRAHNVGKNVSTFGAARRVAKPRASRNNIGSTRGGV